MDNNEKNLEYFNNLKYHVLVKKHKNKYTLYIPELCMSREHTLLSQGEHSTSLCIILLKLFVVQFCRACQYILHPIKQACII